MKAMTAYPRRGGRGGFSLIEISVVIALLAIMAGAVMPMLFQRRNSQGLRHAAAMLADAFAGCYSEAIVSAKRYRWAWDAEARLWRYFRESDSAELSSEFVPAWIGGRSDEAPPKGVTIKGVYFAIRADSEQTPDLERPLQVDFYPDGHCDTVNVVLVAFPQGTPEDAMDPDLAAADETIQLEAMTVSLNGVTGRIKILQGDLMAAPEEAASGELETNLILMDDSGRLAP
ncbi:MAG: hypothetical protein BWZ10_00305 [candidate division BRC1 bacterium ADurb.BinA364]|nr:MAG: hypothetical protein BWZ10_00305 [candidate division BRC1 bacterium ADurb.BinA364]